MSKKLYMVLGNGFSIDFMKHIGRLNQIDIINLFSRGTEVPWPANGMPGFLSFKHCPHLWNLGARPNMSSADSMALIEDIITCVNVYASKTKKANVGNPNRPNDIYIYAYQELLQYLKHLFIFYNGKVDYSDVNIENWAWLEFIKHANESDEYNEIIIVTYNYDIWLERLLKAQDILFNIGMSGVRNDAKITIYKPHGSISFTHRHKTDRVSYSISYDREILDGSLDDFVVKYDELDNNYVVSALIPPAGEAGRFNHTWTSQIRSAAKAKATQLTKDDEMIICGISYWHVDRAEIDELFMNCDPLLNISMINPNPHRTLNAVLTSIFSNYICYSDSEILKRKIECQTF